MFTREELESYISDMRSQLDENTSALLSENFLSIIANYGNALDRIVELENENTNLKNTNDELLKVNGKLFQKIGFEKEEIEEKTEETPEEIKIEDVVNEKGELI